MNSKQVQKVVVDTIKGILTAIGAPCPSLNGSDVPSKVVDLFDSTMWPLATTRIARKLGVEIPIDVHIFGGERGKPLLTIAQTSQMVCDKHVSIATAIKHAA